MGHRWPNKNSNLIYSQLSWFDYLLRPRNRYHLICLILPLIILFLFALSQAGTSLFLLCRFGFSHVISAIFSIMICLSLTCVYFQKISSAFKKTLFRKKSYYKAYRDLVKALKSVENINTLANYKKFQITWLVLQQRHLISALRIAKDDEFSLEKALESTVHQLGGQDMKLMLYNKESVIYKWCQESLNNEKKLLKILKQNKIFDSNIRLSIRSHVTIFKWACLEEANSVKKRDEIISELVNISGLEKNIWLSYFEEIRYVEAIFTAAISDEIKDRKWFEQLKYHRIQTDHKLNPNLNFIRLPRVVFYVGSIANMVVGNNLIGLYGSLAGVAALISFYPILHLSISLKIVIGVFGCLSAAYASYVLTLPMLRKLMKQLSRWRTRSFVRQFLNKKNYTWITARKFDWRFWICVIFAGVVTIAAVHFNMHTTWFLTNRLMALFSGTAFGNYLIHVPIFVKYILMITQGVISFLCAGAIYFTSCFNQYVGQEGKVKLSTISVLDKINKHIAKKSWLKVFQLMVIVTFSALAAVGQTIIWFHGLALSPILLALLMLPACLAFFATFCEAALVCLDDDEDSHYWLDYDDKFNFDQISNNSAINTPNKRNNSELNRRPRLRSSQTGAFDTIDKNVSWLEGADPDPYERNTNPHN